MAQTKNLLLLFILSCFFHNSYGGNPQQKCLECGTGADGAFEVYSDTTIVGGTYNFSSFYVDYGVNVTVTGNQPLIVYCQGDVLILGTLNASGHDGSDGVTFGSAGSGGLGVAGGGNGANGIYDGSLGPLDGFAGSGSGAGNLGSGWGGGAGAGHNGIGMDGTEYNSGPIAAGGMSYGNIQLNSITSGSGGGSGSGGAGCGSGGGGGGGGIIIIHSCSLIDVEGALMANGGNGGSDGTGNCGGGGGGSGGSIWLVANEVYNFGSIEAIGGSGGNSFVAAVGGDGAAGRIRIDYGYLDNSGVMNPAADFGVVPLKATLDASADISCNGLSDGSIAVTVSDSVHIGPSPAYSYLWSNNETTEDIDSLSPGIYSLTVMADYGCYSTFSKTLYQPDSIMLTQDSIADLLCNGDALGLINISATAGVFQGRRLTTDFSSNNGSSGNMFDFDVLKQTEITGFEVNMSGNSDVMIYYKSGTFLGSETDSLAWTFLGTYSVVSSGIDQPSEITLNSPLSIAPGSYSIVLNSLNGNWLYIDGTLQGNLWASNSYFNIYEGIAKTGGGPFSNQIAGPRNFSGSFIYTEVLEVDSYIWSNGSTTEDISGLGGDDYSVTVTNSLNCSTVFGTYTVVEPDSLNVSTSVTVNGNTGDVITSVSGGTMPYSYLWNTTDSSSNLIGVGAGTYSVVVTDNNNCTATASDSVDISVGLMNSNMKSTQIVLYPNPTSGLLNININAASIDDINISLIDMKGQLIESNTYQQVDVKTVQLDLSKYATGVYLLKINNSSESEMHRVNIQH